MMTNHCLKCQWVKTVQFHVKLFSSSPNLSYQQSKICGSVHSNKNVICPKSSVKNPIIKLKISVKSSLQCIIALNHVAQLQHLHIFHEGKKFEILDLKIKHKVSFRK